MGLGLSMDIVMVNELGLPCIICLASPNEYNYMTLQTVQRLTTAIASPCTLKVARTQST